MKKLFALVALVGIFTFSANNVVFADHHLEGDSVSSAQVDTADTTEELV